MKTNEEFLKQIEHRSFEAIDLYAGDAVKIRFKCKIDGLVWSAKPTNILQGCGCPECKKGSISRANRKTNIVLADHGDWLEIDVSTRKHKTAVMKIDKADWERIGGVVGRVNAFTTGVHVYASFAHRHVESFCSRRIHRAILDAPKGLVVDHTDHDTLNNRRGNLRVCTGEQNCRNSRLSKRNTSGVKGVRWQPDRQKWVARIYLDGREKHLGRFDDIDDAIEARKAAEVEFHGEFRYQEAQDSGK